MNPWGRRGPYGALGPQGELLVPVGVHWIPGGVPKRACVGLRVEFQGGHWDSRDYRKHCSPWREKIGGAHGIPGGCPWDPMGGCPWDPSGPMGPGALWTHGPFGPMGASLDESGPLEFVCLKSIAQCCVPFSPSLSFFITYFLGAVQLVNLQVPD